jgi:hypothetical protein
VAVLTVLQYITDALFVSLAGVCFLRWRRERGRAAAWLAVTFGLLAAVVVVGVVLDATVAGEPPAWATKLLLGAIVLFPYLLFRFTAALERAARRTEPVTGSGRGPPRATRSWRRSWTPPATRSSAPVWTASSGAGTRRQRPPTAVPPARRSACR